MAAETQYTPNTGMVTISTANSNLDGTGTLGTVITGASNGTLIKTITIKAIVTTTQGMVRIFVDDAKGGIVLLKEIEIPAAIKSATDPAFEITLPLYFKLKSTYILKASTEKAESFNVIAEGQNWTYYATSVREETTQYLHNNPGVTISAANTNLDGTGTLGTVLQSSNCNIMHVTIKATQTTTAGMIRLFLYDGSVTKLLKEIPVQAVTPSATAESFYHKVVFNNGFALKTGWYLKASTEKGESFNIIPEALNWTYPA